MERVTIELDETDVSALDKMGERTEQSREATVRELLAKWLDQRPE